MKILAKTESWSAKDNFKAIKSRPVSESIGMEVKVQAIAVGTDFSNDDQKEIATGYFRAIIGDKTEIFSTISKTTIQQLEALIEMGEDSYSILICEQKCKKDSKQTFVYLDLVE